MASADVRKELLDCSVCLNIYTDPVTLRCGHNFCRICIDQVLDTQDGSGVYSCPECRAESVERPVLTRNITLCNIVESFCSAQPAQEQTGILCTYCVDSPVLAVKSCLMCEASLCDKHLRVHSKAPDHMLMEPTTSLGNRKCSIHKELLKYYCMDDSACVCVSCRLDGEHQGHQVEVLDKASENKKKKLSNILQELVNTREEAERRVMSLQEKSSKLCREAEDNTKKVSALFTDIRKQLEDLERKVLSEISRQEEHLLLSFTNMIQQLESKKNELSMKIHHIEELCNMTDPLTVLQGSAMLNVEEEDEKEKPKNPLNDGGHLDLGLILQTLHTLYHIVSDVKIEIYIPKPADILLDLNTAHINLHVSDDRKTVSWAEAQQNRPQTPQRFQRFYNVLSTSSFSSGQYYWDVDCSKDSSWRLGMCYPSINREGDQSHFGDNNKSWCLEKKKHIFVTIHDRKVLKIPHNITINRFRISLDYEGGQLSFYELCEPVRHLHTFTTTFTEPLHAAICVYHKKINRMNMNTWVSIIDNQK